MDDPLSDQGSAEFIEPVLKGEGVTSAEQYLGKLCERNFLSLWSYPAIFRDQGKRGAQGDGKEICDLLVIFGNHLIIFSDKHCLLQDSGNTERDWNRWFKKAIQKSADQAWGAERWLRQQPHRVFLNRECTKRLPIDLPAIENAIFHLVVVAHGISKRIRQSFPGSSGSLLIDTTTKGAKNHTQPFVVGDLAPEKTFVHILDDDSLHTLMSARDTVSDFVEYLSARERLLRGKIDIRATGEEQMLAVYLKNLNDKNEHDFVFQVPSGQSVRGIFLQEGHWESFRNSPERLAQLKADRISYFWDRLIEKFSYYAMRGEQYHVSDGGIKDTEQILRFMAREPRWKRRYLAAAIYEIARTTPKDKRGLRVIPPNYPGDPHYVFLFVPTLGSETQAQYRDVRRAFLECCCSIVKLKYPDATDILGIATESGIDNSGRSEDAIYLDARVWTDEMAQDAKEMQKKLGILTKSRSTMRHMEEYPSVIRGKTKNPRNKPCSCGSGKKYKHCCLR